MTPLKLAYLSLTRHRFSTIITVLALGLSISCAGILLRLYLLSESRFSAMGTAGDAIVGAKAGGIEIMLGSLNGEGKYPDFLPYKLFESLRSDQNVKFEDGQSLQPHYIKSIIPFLYFGKYKGFRVVGTDDSFLHRPTTADTLTLKEGRWFKAANDIVVGATFAKSEQLHIGDRIKVNPWIGESILSNEFEFEVSGILQATETRWDYMGFANFVEAQRILGEYPAILSRYSIWGSQVLNYFLVYVNNGGFEKLEALINKRTVGQVIDIPFEQARLKEISGVGKSVGFFVMLFMILLGGLAVCSMLVTRFEGMTVQLAVLRAIGYTKKEISSWLIWEGILLGVLGVLIGFLIDATIFPFLRSALGSALPPADLVASSSIQSYPIWLMAMLATIFSVVVPVVKMSSQDIHSSLKGL